MTTAQGTPATEFLIPESRDREAMAKLGLGGSAVAHGFQFVGAMAIDLTTISRLAEAETIADETRICVDQVRNGLALSGRTLDDVVKMTAYVSEEGYREEMWETLREAFGDRSLPKVVTLVCGIAGDCRVELEAMAFREPEAGTALETDRFVYTGSLAIDVATMKRVPEAQDSIKDEVRVILQRIEANLAREGLGLQDLTKVTAWVSEERYRLEFAYAYAELLAPGPYPSRALFQIGLAGDCRVQIDAMAARRIR
jgi:2-iminobutanoate/2-iminopropanoate deaminase